MKVAVFCSSSENLSPVFYSETQKVGEVLGRGGHHLCFGASDQGLMKVVSRSAMASGARVTGVTTVGLDKICSSVPGLQDLVVCKDLKERKSKLLEMANVVLVLPGGIGTLDELFEVLAVRQVGEKAQKVILYSPFEFWSGLVFFLEGLCEQRMISENLNDYFVIVQSPEQLDQVLQGFQESHC